MISSNYVCTKCGGQWLPNMLGKLSSERPWSDCPWCENRALRKEIERLKAAKPAEHAIYIQLVSHGMPEGLDGEQQGRWLFSEFDRMREQQDEIERLKTAVASMGRILPLQDADIKRLRDDLADYNARHETSLEVIRVREQEVERQRVEIERLKDDYRRWVSTYHEKLMKAENEIERLNAELRMLTSDLRNERVEIARLRKLLKRWVCHADSGNLDGVDLGLMVESETTLEEISDE